MLYNILHFTLILPCMFVQVFFFLSFNGHATIAIFYLLIFFKRSCSFSQYAISYHVGQKASGFLKHIQADGLN